MIDVQMIIDKIVAWVLSAGPRLLLIIILTFVALKLAKVITRRLISFIKKEKEGVEFQKRADTINSLIMYVLSTVIVVVAAMMILDTLGIQIGPILAAAGIVGLAVGFGAQQLVQDVISGFFILIEDQIRVGDVVQVAGQGGLVEAVTLRMIILRDLSGNVHYVRNGQISLVTNMTQKYSYYLFDIGVAYREDYDEVVKVVKEVDETMRNDPAYKDDILEPIEILGLDKFADSAVIIKARVKTRPIKQWGIGREFNRRLKKAFDDRNIEIPFPHVTLYMGQDKDGSAAPMYIVQQNSEKIAQAE
jgi:small-conductance mechanosensitive channel